MISAYHRPQTLDEALTILAQPNTLPLGGGTLLSKPTADSVQVVDLQLLGLNSLTRKGNELEIGATLTLQSLLESEHCPAALKTTLKLEAPLNLRNAATVAGTLVACDGRSALATTLLALDTKLEMKGIETGGVEHGNLSVHTQISNLGDFLPLRDQVRGKLITKIIIPTNVKLAFEYVARTPADKPIVCVALTRWNSGRTRLAVGGYGKSPRLAMDGTEADGIETAAKNAFHEATDEWASAEYRMEVAAILAKRCMNH